jgi:hypothetical protein
MRTVLTAALALLLGGCHNRHYVPLDSGVEAFAEASEITAGRKGSLRRRDVRLERLRWHDIRFTPDSTVGFMAREERAAMPTEQVREVTVVHDRGKATLLGLLGGAAVGGLILTTESSGGENFVGDLGKGVLAIMAVPAGALGGLFSGMRDTVHFEEEPSFIRRWWYLSLLIPAFVF